MVNYEKKYHKYKQKYLNLNENTHHFSFRDPHGYPLMQQIIDGTKTVEGRKNSEIYQKVKVGDTIILKDNNRGAEIACLIKAIRKYPDIKTYLENEIKNALPSASTINEGLDVYHTFIKDEEIQNLKDKYGYGFIAFEISFIK